MKKFSIALQVYSIREQAEKDFAGNMAKVKALGYDGVELAGLYGLAPEKIRDILKENGLNPISAHVPYLELIEDMAGTIEKYVTIGCKYIAIPYLNEEYRPGTDYFGEVVQNIEKIGKMCREKGIQLLYHNHDFEFARMPDGEFALDYMYRTISADYLQTEVDTCWVTVVNVDPAEYIRKYSGRSPVVHLKDFIGERSDNMYELIGIEKDKEAEEQAFEFRALGEGKVNFLAILAASEDAGSEWVVVEQDQHYNNDPLDNCKTSIEYLRRQGL